MHRESGTAVSANTVGGAAASTGFVAPGWTLALAMLAGGLVLVVLAFWSTWQALAAVWSASESYAHGYLIAPIAAWLFWRERREVLASPPAVGLAGLATIALGLCVWLVGALGSMAVVQFAGVVSAAAGVVMASIGDRLSWRFAFPIAFLVFMIPMGGGLVPTLIDWTADATVASLRATGFPVYREGRFFSLPTGRWEVEAGCSGLRYLIAATVLAVLFAYLNLRSLHRRIAFVGFAVLLSLAANWVRAYMIVLIGHYSEMRYGTGTDHLWYGWVFFGLVMGLVFWVGHRWAEVAPGRGDAMPPRVRPATRGSRRVDFAVRSVAVGAIAAATVAVWSASDRVARVSPRADAPQIAAGVLGARTSAPIGVGSRFDGARHLEHGRLATQPGVEYLVGYYAAQVPGAELITVTNEAVDDTSGRFRIEHEQRVNAGPELVAEEVLVREGDGHWLVWQWYTVDGSHYASQSRVKLATVRSLLLRGVDDSAVTVLALRLDASGIDAGRTTLRKAAETVRGFGEAITQR